ncbi:cell wall-binding protein [Clostridium sp.]|uniref:cell wall-binding protein n=1 Tax=Clostridium sp. TaxID=1506 RepID=UPI0028424E19|nr:cell wall-binding protein [Clostridium sp.]MDR3594169.1 cell wall-binding protein [Clostridium sp.]
MKKFKRLIVSFATLIMLLAIAPISAHAEWRQGNNGWWYSQGGSSYATGWTKINGQWYYFDSNGYMETGWINDNGNWFYTYGDGTMAHDTKIDGYYLNSSGAWTNSVPTSTSYNANGYSGSTSSYVGDNQSQTVYVSKNGIYHSSPTAHGMKYYTPMSRADAEKAGYRACKICY